MLAQTLVNGLVLGSLYGMIAVAFTMIYGIIGLVNFAFGEMFMFGAFGALWAISPSNVVVTDLLPSLGLPAFLAVLVGIAVGAGLGFVVYIVAYRTLRGRPILTLLVATIAASIMLRGFGQYLFGTADHSFPELVSGVAFEFAGAVVLWSDILIVAVAAALMGLFAWFVLATPIGRAMRATAQDPEVAGLLGINVERTIITAFLIGSALAATSGIFYASHFQFANPNMGFFPGLKGLVGAVLGGIGNLPGAFVGGMIIGFVETLSSAYVPMGSAYRDVIVFAVLVAILFARPQGLLGARVPERA
jgi:branched-chain amino acid transport system permease protein